jgi:hypothetical protein
MATRDGTPNPFLSAPYQSTGSDQARYTVLVVFSSQRGLNATAAEEKR